MLALSSCCDVCIHIIIFKVKKMYLGRSGMMMNASIWGLKGWNNSKLLKTDAFSAQTRQHPVGAPVPLGAFPTQGGWRPPATPAHLFHLTASSLDEQCNNKHIIPTHCKPSVLMPRVVSTIHFGYFGAHSTDLYRISCWSEWKYVSYLVSNKVLEIYESQELPQKIPSWKQCNKWTLLMHLRYICIP